MKYFTLEERKIGKFAQGIEYKSREGGRIAFQIGHSIVLSFVNSEQPSSHHHTAATVLRITDSPPRAKSLDS